MTQQPFETTPRKMSQPNQPPPPKRTRQYYFITVFLVALCILLPLNILYVVDFSVDKDDPVEFSQPIKPSYLTNHFRVRHLLSAKPSSSSHDQKSSQHVSTSPSVNSSHHRIKEHDAHAKCVRPDIEQFPRSLFGQKARRHGAVLMHFLVALYMFIGLAIVCDDYFVPSLQALCKILNLKEDVAG